MLKKSIDEYGRFTSLKETIDRSRAEAYLEVREGKELSLFLVSRETDRLLRGLILRGELPEDLDVTL